MSEMLVGVSSWRERIRELRRTADEMEAESPKSAPNSSLSESDIFNNSSENQSVAQRPNTPSELNKMRARRGDAFKGDRLI